MTPIQDAANMATGFGAALEITEEIVDEMKETPRTDDCGVRALSRPVEYRWQSFEDCARQLERELEQARQDLVESQKMGMQAIDELSAARVQIAALEATLTDTEAQSQRNFDSWMEEAEQKRREDVRTCEKIAHDRAQRYEHRSGDIDCYMYDAFISISRSIRATFSNVFKEKEMTTAAECEPNAAAAQEGAVSASQEQTPVLASAAALCPIHGSQWCSCPVVKDQDVRYIIAPNPLSNADTAQIKTLKQARREDEATLTALQNARVQEARSAQAQIAAVLSMLKEWNRSAQGDGIDGRELKRLVLKTEKVLDAAMREEGKS